MKAAPTPRPEREREIFSVVVNKRIIVYESEEQTPDTRWWIRKIRLADALLIPEGILGRCSRKLKGSIKEN